MSQVDVGAECSGQQERRVQRSWGRCLPEVLEGQDRGPDKNAVSEHFPGGSRKTSTCREALGTPQATTNT